LIAIENVDDSPNLLDSVVKGEEDLNGRLGFLERMVQRPKHRREIAICNRSRNTKRGDALGAKE